MQRAMYQQVRGMFLHANALFGRLAFAYPMRKHDIAQQQLAIVAILADRIDQIRLHHGKGQDVGRLVFLPILTVERVDLIVGSQADADLDGRRRSEQFAMRRPLDRRARGPDGEPIPIKGVGPGHLMGEFDMDHSSIASFRSRRGMHTPLEALMGVECEIGFLAGDRNDPQLRVAHEVSNQRSRLGEIDAANANHSADGFPERDGGGQAVGFPIHPARKMPRFRLARDHCDDRGGIDEQCHSSLSES
ncbi:hypothetical protein WR25_14118 [Diploscapter pachys]|uniref:Uncharacterized protein n=1 Tax=Diploscapter pachys TaxID=2018661 RepID=A0A2A2KLK3_9BILA|nr:hypothetical protein WR25_14118 [Diploscapter pachys]